MAKVGIGGAGYTPAVAVTLQPSWSLAVTCTTAVPVIGMVYCADVLLVLMLIGSGDHTKVEGVAAEPAGVTLTTAMEFPQVAWRADALSKGAGVIVEVTTR